MAGEMTPQEYAEVVRLIDAKVPNASMCLSCGKQAVAVASHLVTPVGTGINTGIALQAANYPQAMLLCGHCGYTRYYNVMVLRAPVIG